METSHDESRLDGGYSPIRESSLAQYKLPKGLPAFRPNIIDSLILNQIDEQTEVGGMNSPHVNQSILSPTNLLSMADHARSKMAAAKQPDFIVVKDHPIKYRNKHPQSLRSPKDFKSQTSTSAVPQFPKNKLSPYKMYK